MTTEGANKARGLIAAELATFTRADICNWSKHIHDRRSRQALERRRSDRPTPYALYPVGFPSFLFDDPFRLMQVNDAVMEAPHASTMELILAVFWVGGCFAIAVAAAARGRKPWAWFVLALLISPLLAAIVLLAYPPRFAAEGFYKGYPIAMLPLRRYSAIHLLKSKRCSRAAQ